MPQVTFSISDTNFARLVAALDARTVREPESEADGAFIRRMLKAHVLGWVHSHESKQAVLAVPRDDILEDV